MLKSLTKVFSDGLPNRDDPKISAGRIADKLIQKAKTSIERAQSIVIVSSSLDTEKEIKK